MNRDPADTNPNLPPWLRGQPLPLRPVSEDAPQSQPHPPAESESIPAWLRAEAGETPANAEPIPDWLREQAATPPATSEALPDWLRESEPRAESLAAAPTEETIPDWLRGLSDEPASTSAATTPAVQAETGSVPDWLLAMAEDAPADATPKPATLDWLAEPAQPAIQAEAITSDWMHEAPDEPLTPPQVPAAEPPTVDSWLSDIPQDQIRAAMATDEETLTATPFSFDDGMPPQPSAPTSGPPAWLGDASDTATSNWFDPPPAAPANQNRDLNDDDAPAWLKGPSEPASSAAPQASAAEPAYLRTEPPLGAETTPTAAPNPTPAWLGNIVPTPANQPDAPSADATTPSWLHNAAPPNTANAAANEDIPAWLRAEPQPALETPSLNDLTTPSETPAQAPQDVPNWLSQPAANASAASGDPTLPLWLQGEQTATPVAPVLPTLPANPPSLADSNIPPWLRDERGAALPTASEPGEQDLPPWLKGAAIGGAAVGGAALAGATAEAAQAQTPERIAERTHAPINNWFDDAVSGADAPGEASENEFLGSTDLPAWMRRPQEQKTPADSADSRAFDWLTRLGSPEEDPATPAVATTRLAPPLTPAKSPAQLQAIALLQQLATEPIAAVPQPAVAEPHSFWKRAVVERLLYVLLLLALLAGPLFPALSQPLAVPPTLPAAQQLYDQIHALGPSNIVLIGYDWDARRVAELRPMEDAVIDELIARKVKLVLMSTDPQGSLLLYDLRERLNRAGYQPGGEDYVLLGYQPGGEFALRSLAQNVSQVLRSDFQGADMSNSPLALGKSTGTGKPLASLSDFSMIMLLADEQVDVQSWMEQVHQPAQNTPFSILMTAEAAPAADPYIRQSGVYGLTGTTGALAFTALRGGDTAKLTATVSQLRLGLASFAVLLVFGGLVATIVAALRRRRA